MVLGHGGATIPFTVCSVDYKTVIPPNIGGYTDFYVFVEGYYTYKFVVCLKEFFSAAVLFVDAVKNVRFVQVVLDS